MTNRRSLPSSPAHSGTMTRPWENSVWTLSSSLTKDQSYLCWKGVLSISKGSNPGLPHGRCDITLGNISCLRWGVHFNKVLVSYEDDKALMEPSVASVFPRQRTYIKFRFYNAHKMIHHSSCFKCPLARLSSRVPVNYADNGTKMICSPLILSICCRPQRSHYNMSLSTIARYGPNKGSPFFASSKVGCLPKLLLQKLKGPLPNQSIIPD